MWSASLIGQDSTEEDESLSLSESDSSGLSDSSWFSQSSPRSNDTHHPSTFSDNNQQDLVYPSDCSKAIGFERPTAIDICIQPAVAEQIIDPTMDDAIPSESPTTPEESAQPSSVCPSLPSLMQAMIEFCHPETGASRLDLPSSARSDCLPTYWNAASLVLQDFAVGRANRHAERIYWQRHHSLRPAGRQNQE